MRKDGMRLLIVDEEIIGGGVETLRLNLIPELARYCESLVWVLPQPHDGTFRERMGAIPNLVVETLSWPRGSVRHLFTASLRRLPRAFLLRNLAEGSARQLLNARILELARQHGSVACLTTCALTQPPPTAGLPLAAFVCDLNPALPERVRHNIIGWLRSANLVFGISEFTCAELRRLAPDCSAKIRAVPMAAPSCSRGHLFASQSKIDFYFPAAANEHKGHLVLFQACLLLARRGFDFRLGLSGPGTGGFLPGGTFAKPDMESARRFLESHAEELHGRIKVAGDVTPEEVDALYASARSVVLPSRYEGFGLPLAEALRRGKEILCSDIPPFREQLAIYDTFDCAQIIPPGDSVRLADAMERILKTPLVSLSPAEIDRRMARWTWTDAARCCYDHLSMIPAVNLTSERCLCSEGD
jgi:glycosyltransferase involved in cell wall biosynthesis